MGVLMKRNLVISLIEPELYTGRLILFAITSVIIALYMWDARNDGQAQVIPRMWALTLANWWVPIFTTRIVYSYIRIRLAAHDADFIRRLYDSYTHAARRSSPHALSVAPPGARSSRSWACCPSSSR